MARVPHGAGSDVVVVVVVVAREHQDQDIASRRVKGRARSLPDHGAVPRSPVAINRSCL